MGRAIRRVPPHWKHPHRQDADRDRFQPMYAERYEDARAEWLEGLRAWDAGEHPAREAYKNADGSYQDWWEWHGPPPDRAEYRPWSDADATWWQLWETVSEGTPVSPPFATQDELAQYLADHGDFWDQRRGDAPWGIDTARAFVFGPGWALSLVSMDGQVMSGVEYMTRTAQKDGGKKCA